MPAHLLPTEQGQESRPYPLQFSDTYRLILYKSFKQLITELPGLASSAFPSAISLGTS